MKYEKRMKKLRLQKELLPKYRQSCQTLTKITSDQKKKIERRKNKSQEEKEKQKDILQKTIFKYI